jgi:GNAT superfamily N-acetyltransferase
MINRIHGRVAVAADIPRLAELNKQLIDDEGHRNPMTVSELAARMMEWLKGEYKAAVFDVEGETIGYALYRFDPDYVYLRQFFIARNCRREGFGREAIAWCKEHAWKGSIRVRIDVLAKNSAGIAFWNAVGFTDYAIAMEMPL